ncbi:CD209 antigen-like protein E [Sitophilus oryzae]|uniref:CD209 antigen-like protein E n=1 Tax=Sitophilus oryzae TaxID=7048 RepID=A0A6J2XKY7_SITOR|nr:CD209 antigen-like protein E [Sitophilus oryzae]
MISNFNIVFCVLCGLCASGFVPTVYSTYMLSIEALNWTDAKEACNEAGLELASVISNEERDNIEKFLVENNQKPVDKWSGYWLDGIRYPNGTFYWDTTGTEVGDGVENGFVLGEPSNAYQKEHCIELKWDDVNLGWNDYFCAEKKRYLCQNPRKEGPKSEGLDDYSFLDVRNPENLSDHFRDPFPRRIYFPRL